MSTPTTIVVRLIGGRYEGQWWAVEPGRPYELEDETGAVHLVPTGCVEWYGNRCAEVYVPASKLVLWRAEHDVDAP